ncbi:MAG: sulfatase [Bryobacterales bacterium]|nr:sulfatase [Bryobacterales bacterium]
MGCHHSRRSFLQHSFATAGALGTAAATGCGTQQSSAPKLPNFLFVFADDWSYPHAGAYGDLAVKTPNFDRIAREGVLFTHSFCASPSCTPSRSTVLSGRQLYRAREAGVLFGSIPKDLPLFTHALADGGYFVGFTGKGWGPGDPSALGMDRSPTGKPFQEQRHVGELRQGINPRDYAACFGDFLAARPQNQPFFFWLGGFEPHRAYQDGAGRNPGRKLSDAKVPAFWPNVEVIQSDILDYYSEIEWLDDQLGKALVRLEKAGELDNTMIVVSSDNGMPFPRAKASLYDYGTRMPLAIRWGNSAVAGRVVNDFVSHIDFAPTFLEAAGLASLPGSTGRSLVPLLKSSQRGIVDETRDHVVTAFERHTLCRPDNATYPMRALRTRDFLYIRNFEPDRWPTGGPSFMSIIKQTHGDVDGSPTKSFFMDPKNQASYPELYALNFGKRPKEELYDVRTDPDNVRNLAGKESAATALARHRDRLENILRGEGDPRIEGLDPWQAYKWYTATPPSQPTPAAAKPAGG